MKIFIILLLILPIKAFSSSCCGGGSSSSMIITSDNQKEFSFGFSHRTDIGQTNQNGFSSFNNSKIIDEKNSFNLSASFLVYDQLQAGLKTSFVEKTVQKVGKKEINRGLSEIEGQITFEYLPEYNYNPLKPRAFIYSKLSIPTSNSIYNSSSQILSDVRGSGLYSFTIGNFLFKKLDDFTLKFSTEITHHFDKKFNDINLSSYQKITVPFGLAYSISNSDFSIGLTDTFNYTTPKKTTSNTTSISSREYYWELNSFINYSKLRDAIWSFSYSDSSLIGKSINSPLYRTFGLTYTFVQEI